jgi:hypothetical protein
MSATPSPTYHCPDLRRGGVWAALEPFVWGAVIAYVLSPVVAWIESRTQELGWKRAFLFRQPG